MTRPTIYIDHPASLVAATRRGEGPTAGLYCGMAGHHRHGCIAVVDALAPHYDDMKAVRSGEISIHTYARRCLDKWGVLDLSPGAPAVSRLSDSCGLFCECARPKSKSRRHPCHRELWPLVLVPAGWDCVLYGRRITYDELHLPAPMDGPVPMGPPEVHPVLRYADGPELYDADQFGWTSYRHKAWMVREFARQERDA